MVNTFKISFKVISKLLLLSLVLLNLGATPSSADPIEYDETTRELCNQIMKNIFNEIESNKDRYEYLKLYTKFAFKTNEWGLNHIRYRYIHTVGGQQRDNLQYNIEFVPLEVDRDYAFDGAHFEYVFPILKLKLIVYQSATKRKNQLEILPIVKEHARMLHDYQSKFMPVRLNIYTEKENYKVGEPIELFVTLENVSGSNIKVKELSSKSLAFTNDDQKWGIDLNRKIPQYGSDVLRGEKTFKRRFKLNGFENTGEVAIHANYLMNFKGAMPTDTIYLNIIK